MIDVLLKALLLIILITAFSLGVGLWIAEGRFSKELMNSTTIEQDAGSLNGSPASIELIEEQIKKQLRWQLLFMAWFYPAKILIQTVIKSRRWQLLIYLFNAAVATVWIWGHRINWESNIGETIYFMIIGEPVLFLFIPTVFFLTIGSISTFADLDR